MLDCNVCGNQLDHPVFISPNKCSMDSEGNFFDQETQLFFCDQCGHLQSRPLSNVEEYYQNNYNFLIRSDDEDQLYTVTDGKPVYRQDHQINVLLQKLEIPQNARVLDYGCAKGAFLKKLVARKDDLKPYFFDVSEVYIPFWEKIASPDQWAVFTPKPEWQGQFDVVFTLFSLEHITNPKEIVANIASLLKPGGILYSIVPNPHGIYIADYLVADHVNHFSESSLRYLLTRNGFEVVEIDSHSHDVAYTIVGKKTDNSEPHVSSPAELAALKKKVEETSNLWMTAALRIRSFERDHGHQRASAIYGAGVVGVFIASCLNDLSKVRCFIDQNPYKQGQSVVQKPIVSIAELDSDIEVIYVGLNPAVNHAAIQNIEQWKGRPFEFFYL